jgi:hypothetical protein
MSTDQAVLNNMSDFAPILSITPDEVYIKHEDHECEGQWVDLPADAKTALESIQESIRELMQQAVNIVA